MRSIVPVGTGLDAQGAKAPSGREGNKDLSINKRFVVKYFVKAVFLLWSSTVGVHSLRKKTAFPRLCLTLRVFMDKPWVAFFLYLIYDICQHVLWSRIERSLRIACSGG